MQNDPRDPLDTIVNVRSDSPTDIELKRQTPLTEKEKLEIQRRGRRLLFRKPWYTWIIVAFVIAMIVWTYTTYVFHFVIPWVFILGRYYGMVFFILFTAMTALVSYSYYMAVTTHPGLAPNAWVRVRNCCINVVGIVRRGTASI
jgi:cellulose synthase/poly-beta-1,6-N-acetylglucosamine synthase-like glycosyltransferase